MPGSVSPRPPASWPSCAARIVDCHREGKIVLYYADRKGTQAALSDLQRYLSICC